MRALVHFTTPDSDDQIFSDEREFVRLPSLGDLIVTGPVGPSYIVAMVEHNVAIGDEPSVEIHAMRIELEQLQHLAEKRIVEWLS